MLSLTHLTGFGAASDQLPTFTTWNPSDKAAGVTLSLANLKATSGSTYSNVRSVASITSGKRYWEVTLNVANVGGAGIANGSASLTTFPGGSANGWVACDSGIYTNNVQLGTTTYAAGDRINIALDMTSGKLWFGKNGTWVGSGDPAGGTNPTYTGITGTIYAIGGGGNTTAVTANFGASAFTDSVPSGFISGLY